MTPKELKKLADTCRKSGIKHYKCQDFEFTLTDSAPTIPTRRNKKGIVVSSNSPLVEDKVESDQQLTDDQLLFWSSASDGVQ